MPKTTAVPPALNLSAARHHNADGQSPLSPALLSSLSTASPLTPHSASGSPALHLSTMHHIGGGDDNTNNGLRPLNSPVSPRITAMPEFPPSPDRANSREPSKSFFSNFKASKSSHRLHSPEASIAESTEKTNGRSRASSKERSLHSLRRHGSTPDLPRIIANSNNNKIIPEGQNEATNGLVPPGSSDGTSISQKKAKSKLGGFITRTKPMKTEDERLQKKSPTQLNLDNHALQYREGDPNSVPPVKTAPLRPDYRERAFGLENGSAQRARSADRHGSDDAGLKRPAALPSIAGSSLPKENSSLFNNIQQTGKGVGSRLGQAGKGFFSKMRSGSSTEREVPTEENYICTTINLPLVQQTRKTRIAKRLELSRDKTEFWMPALPWRCIDYLNMNGCEEEGLYRIPGSGREVKMWQKRFDTEHDINLFDEPELYDINTIGSMFKSWLRELPDEILPKTTQNKIAKQCSGATTVPQLLKDELSRLPPFNYYLLFAITCHLSLLHSFADKNKMDYRNLCICFQPCLKIDAFCFQYLVINWKDCWQGCWTEHEHLQEEYRWEREGSIKSHTEGSTDERAISSSGSSHIINSYQPPARSAETGVPRKSSMPHLKSKQRSLSSGAGGVVTRASPAPSHTNSSSVPTVPRIVGTPEQKTTSDQQLPELSNLSPLRM